MIRLVTWTAALLVAAASADASLIPVLDGGSATADPLGFRYTYNVSLSADHRLSPAENPTFFALYDFIGFVPGTATAPSADWVFSVVNAGPIAELQAPNDDPGGTNLVWQYVGDTLGAGLANEMALGQFSAVSTIAGTTHLFVYSGQTTKDAASAPEDGTRAGNSGYITGPNAAAAPEPSSLLLASLAGLGGLGLIRRRQAKNR